MSNHVTSKDLVLYIYFHSNQLQSYLLPQVAQPSPPMRKWKGQAHPEGKEGLFFCRVTQE